MAKQHSEPKTSLFRQSVPHTLGALGAGGLGAAAGWGLQRVPELSAAWVALAVSAVALAVATIALWRK